MLPVILTILFMSVLFSLAAGGTLLLRRRFRGGTGALFFRLWFAVMLLSVLPIRINTPIFGVAVGEPETYVPDIQITDTKRNADLTDDPDDGFGIGEGWIVVTPSEDGENRFTVFVPQYLMWISTCLLSVWFAGVLYHIGGTLHSYCSVSKTLRNYSRQAAEERHLKILTECRKKVGLRRNVMLRIVNAEYPISPCVSGIFRPTVYLGADSAALDDETLSFIITHELCHVRRWDGAYKLLLSVVLAVHFWNPLRGAVQAAVCEDAELACDSTVLHYLGEDSVHPYMESILRVAELLHADHTAESVPIASALFFAKDRKPGYLKRRYLHMCAKKGQPTERLAAFLLLTCILISNFALNSVCGYAETEKTAAEYRSVQEKKESRTWVYDPLDVALHNYFSVPQTEPIEEEKLLTVRTIDVTFVGEYREEASDQMSSYVCFSFNGEKPVTLAPTIFYADQFRNEILEKVKGADSEGEKEADQRDFFVQKLNAFYSEKNISDPMLTEEGLRELIHVFPETLNGAIVVYDPYVTKREDQTIYGILISMGIIRNVSYTEADIRTAVSANHALLGACLTFHS